MKDKALGMLLNQGDRLLIKRLNRNFAKSGYSVSQEQWLLLRQLWEKDGVKQQVLADAVGKDKVNITKLVDSLEKRKMVKRVNDKVDRRAKKIYLTEQGKALKDELNAIVDQTFSEALGSVTDKDYKSFEKVVVGIIENLTKD